MSRTIDQACELEELHRATALAQFRQRQQHAPISAHECEDCGEPIPEARRQAVIGCVCCVSCQAKREKYAKA